MRLKSYDEHTKPTSTMDCNDSLETPEDAKQADDAKCSIEMYLRFNFQSFYYSYFFFKKRYTTHYLVLKSIQINVFHVVSSYDHYFKKNVMPSTLLYLTYK